MIPYSALLLSAMLLVVSDTLIKLMEYGKEDDDPDEIAEEPSKSNSNGFSVNPKPFWAV